ncbi:MAG: hypothetical protein K9G48_03660 [Reyranella sp.]|nr:hypothetical protein [Reyranella sp.]
MKAWLSVVALCLVPGVSWGQSAGFKCAKPGTVVEYSDGARTEWKEAGAGSCRLAITNKDGTVLNDWYGPMSSVKVGGSKAWVDQVKPQQIWPLTVGKKFSARYDGAASIGAYQGSWTFTYTVEKFERITTKAGTFDVFHIVRTQEAISHNFKETWQQWYAPDLGVVVRHEYQNNEGRTNKGDAISIR